MCFFVKANQNSTQPNLYAISSFTSSLPFNSKIMFAVGDRCIYDGGASAINDGKYFIVTKCVNSGSPLINRQEFIYNTNTMQIMNLRLEIGWCVDSGGSDKKLFTYQLCDPVNPNQLFYYDSNSQQLLSPYLSSSLKTSIILPFNPYSMPTDQVRCVDTNAGLVQLKPCGPYQKFSIINNGFAPTGAPQRFAFNIPPTIGPSKSTPLHVTINSAPTTAPTVAFNPMAAFLIQSVLYPGYCIHSPSTVRVTTNIQLQPCQYPAIANQMFIYNDNKLKLANVPSLCLDASKTIVSLLNCVGGDHNQLVTYNSMKKFVTINNLCFDCAGGVNIPLTFTPWYNGQNQRWKLENTK